MKKKSVLTIGIASVTLLAGISKILSNKKHSKSNSKSYVVNLSDMGYDNK